MIAFCGSNELDPKHHEYCSSEKSECRYGVEIMFQNLLLHRKNLFYPLLVFLAALLVTIPDGLPTSTFLRERLHLGQMDLDNAHLHKGSTELQNSLPNTGDNVKRRLLHVQEYNDPKSVQVKSSTQRVDAIRTGQSDFQGPERTIHFAESADNMKSDGDPNQSIAHNRQDNQNQYYRQQNLASPQATNNINAQLGTEREKKTILTQQDPLVTEAEQQNKIYDTTLDVASKHKPLYQRTELQPIMSSVVDKTTSKASSNVVAPKKDVQQQQWQSAQESSEKQQQQASTIGAQSHQTRVDPDKGELQYKNYKKTPSNTISKPNSTSKKENRQKWHPSQTSPNVSHYQSAVENLPDSTTITSYRHDNLLHEQDTARIENQQQTSTVPRTQQQQVAMQGKVKSSTLAKDISTQSTPPESFLQPAVERSAYYGADRGQTNASTRPKPQPLAQNSPIDSSTKATLPNSESMQTIAIQPNNIITDSLASEDITSDYPYFSLGMESNQQLKPYQQVGSEKAGAKKYGSKEFLKKLQLKHNFVGEEVVLPPSFDNIVNFPSDLELDDIPVLWNIPKGGTAAFNDIMAGCLQRSIANHVGAQYDGTQDKTLHLFERHGATFVNVDMFTIEGIARAKKLHLASSGIVEAIVVNHIHEVSDLFSPTHKGVFFTVMRDPIERALVSIRDMKEDKTAPTYNPALANMTVEAMAKSGLLNENWMTRWLSNQLTGPLSEQHLKLAKQILRSKFVVGLYNRMEKSMEHFEKYFEWRVKGNAHREQCVGEHIANVVNKNDVSLEMPPEGSKAYNALLAINHFDVELYRYGKILFQMQADYFNFQPRPVFGKAP